MRIRFWALALVLASTAAGAQSNGPGNDFYDALRAGDGARLASLITTHGAATADGQGQTPLMLAAAVGTVDAMRTLLAAGADARAVSGAGVTALHLAVTDLDKTRLLLDAGADVNAVSQIGRTPLLVAASIHGATSVVRLLLERGAKIDVTDSAGITPLSAAAFNDNGEIAQLLVERGADVKVAAGSNPLSMPLLGAAANGNTVLVRALLDRGADANAPSAEFGPTVKNGRITFGGVSPLHLAVNSREFDTVRALLAAGARVDARDTRGLTPLMFGIATDRPNIAIVSLLLKSGAQSSQRDKEGESAIDWAHKFDNPAVMKLLNVAPARAAATAPDPRAQRTAGLMASHQASRQAVERALPALRDVSSSFFAKGGCVACHAQPLTGLAVRLASVRGWTRPGAEPDLTTLAASLNAGAPALMQFREAGGIPDSFLYMMLQLAADGGQPTRATDVMVRYLVGKQRASGEWAGVGGTRAPMQDGDVNRTALAIRALTSYMPPASSALYRERVRRAAGWLQKQTSAGTQDSAMRLLGLHWAGSPVAGTAHLNELRALQLPDGGWPQTKYLPGDAYATGLALYALRTLGVPATDAAVQRGAAFLIRTQQQDGTWHVASRAMKLQPYFDSGFPYEHDQWISHAGSAWAAAALVLSTPEEAPTTARR